MKKKGFNLNESRCNILEEKVIERVKALEVEINHINDDVDTLKNDNTILHKMQVLLEMQTNSYKELVDSNKRLTENQIKFDERLDGFDRTLNSLNENITLLNKSQKSLQHEMASIKEDISLTNNELADVKKKAEANEEKSKIDMRDIYKKIFIGIIMGVAGYFLAQLGINFK